MTINPPDDPPTTGIPTRHSVTTTGLIVPPTTPVGPNRDRLLWTAVGLATVAVLVGVFALVTATTAVTVTNQDTELGTDLQKRVGVLQQRTDRVGADTHWQCTTLGYLLGSYDLTGRDRYPLGSGAYDTKYRQMQQAADTLRCGIPHITGLG